MKKLIVIFVAFNYLSASFAQDQCALQASKAAALVESFSQKAPMQAIRTNSKLVSQVQEGGEFLNTYTVETFDTRNDGTSIYQVSILSGQCSIIKSIVMTTQD